MYFKLVEFMHINLYEIILPETNISPDNGWLEDELFLLGWFPGRCELAVSGRFNIIKTFKSTTFYSLRLRQRIAHFAHHEDESSRGQVGRDFFGAGCIPHVVH